MKKINIDRGAFLLTFWYIHIDLNVRPPQPTTCTVRQIRKTDKPSASCIPVPQSYSQSDTDQPVACFYSECTSVLDTIAPLKERRPKPHSQPWFNDHTRTLRQMWRRAECKWNRNCAIALPIIRRKCWKARNDFLAEILSQRFCDWVLFSPSNKVLLNHPAGFTTPSSPASDYFLNYFNWKKK